MSRKRTAGIVVLSAITGAAAKFQDSRS